MQAQRGKAGIAERLIKEQSFREAARQAFQQADQTQTSDLLQRCKALNACIRQGFVRQPAQQQEESATDSDICSSRSSADSELSDSDIEEPSAVVATGTKADQIASLTYPALLRRPTLVQHAAAATIQRSFRQHIAVRTKQGSVQRCRPLWEATAKSPHYCLHSLVSPTSDEQQHKAASCIQSWWRQRMAERRHVPLTPPSTYPQTAMTSSSMLFSRPDSAASSRLSETEQLSEGSAYDGGGTAEVTTPAGLAELRVSTAAKLRRLKSPVALSSQAPIKGAAMLVVQRTSERAQQVEAMEQQKWLAAQFCS